MAQALKIILIILISLAGDNFAQASNSKKTFWSDLAATQKICPELNCPSGLLKKHEITQYQWRNLSIDIRKRLSQTARQIVNEIWPDTVLEGDFVIRGTTRLEEVQFVMKGLEKVGFWIFYSIKAWDVSNCGYDPIENPSFEGCELGRLYEAAYVSFAVDAYLVDASQKAFFKKD